MKNNLKKKQVLSVSIFERIRNLIRLAVVPHKNNDYRPHLIRRYGLVTVIFTVIGLQVGYYSTTNASVLGDKTDITINALFEQTNQVRLQANIPSLNQSIKLNQAAYLKAQDMFADQYWSHNAPDGTLPWKWMGDIGYDYSEAGENLAMNYTTTSDVMEAWMNSPEHKENVLRDSYQDVGFAVVSGTLDNRPTTIVVALYAVPAQVAGASTKTFTEATPDSQAGFLTNAFSLLQFITPAAMAGLLILAFTVIVSASAHTYRDKLPKKLRKSWYRNHGVYKIFVLAIVGSAIIYLCNGGQI